MLPSFFGSESQHFLQGPLLTKSCRKRSPLDVARWAHQQNFAFLRAVLQQHFVFTKGFFRQETDPHFHPTFVISCSTTLPPTIMVELKLRCPPRWLLLLQA